MLIPRVALTSTTDVVTIPAPATSLMVYNTATANDVSPGFYFFNGAAWTRMTDAASTPSYTIGQSLYGGKIFWLDSTRQHGLIAATNDAGADVQWFNKRYMDNNAIRTGIYGGEYNTRRIIEIQGSGNYAASVAARYNGGNFGDWYLPSKDELNLMYQQKDLIGNLSGFYWSSTEVAVSGTDATYDFAWTQSFSNGLQFNSTLKNQLFKVRPIRRF